jgi:hypothetical protein
MSAFTESVVEQAALADGQVVLAACAMRSRG